jgi:uncharacterized protein YjbJ (UPF0337 family)
MQPSRSANSDLGRASTEARKQFEGVVDEASGAAQELYGRARDKASDVMEDASRAAQATAGSFAVTLRSTIREQPYIAVAVAGGLGWLFGRLRRPF